MVYVIIVNWNNWADTIECLESVFRLDYERYRVIVCDNCSNDNSIHFIKSWAKGRLNIFPSTIETIHSLTFPPVPKPVQFVFYERARGEHGGDVRENASLVLIQTGANLGFAGANNVGLLYALSRNDFDYVWLLNNDTVIKSNALSCLVNTASASPNAGMLGSTLLNFEDGALQAPGGGAYNKLLAKVRAISPEKACIPGMLDYISGASMLLTKKFLHQVGMLNTEYFLYFEELDLACRGAAKGFSLAYALNSCVYHKGGASIGSGSVMDYYAFRNKIVFTKNYYPYYLASVNLVLMISAFIKLVCGQPARAVIIIKILLAEYKHNYFNIKA